MNTDEIRSLLELPPVDVIRVLKDIKEKIEIVYSTEFGSFLSITFPVFNQLLAYRFEIQVFFLSKIYFFKIKISFQIQLNKK